MKNKNARGVELNEWWNEKRCKFAHVFMDVNSKD